METSILQKLNLNENEILIYEELLKGGEQTARQLALKTPLKRGLVYKTLEDLEKKGLIIKNDETNKVSTFTPIHPNVLKGLAEQQLKQAKEAKEELEKELGSLVSMYNLANNKPGVEFYEGLEGVKKVIWDTLTSKTDIYTFADLEKIDKYIKKINAEYAKKRNLLFVRKKIIFPDSPYTHKKLPRYEIDNLDIRLLDDNTNFNTIVEIYDNKISFITLSDSSMIGVIIQDKNIYETQKMLFENIWKNAKKLSLNK